MQKCASWTSTLEDVHDDADFEAILETIAAHTPSRRKKQRKTEVRGRYVTRPGDYLLSVTGISTGDVIAESGCDFIFDCFSSIALWARTVCFVRRQKDGKRAVVLFFASLMVASIFVAPSVTFYRSQSMCLCCDELTKVKGQWSPTSGA